MNKKTIVASLMTGLTFTAALSPMLANADMVSGPPKVESNYQSTEQTFINKFNASVKLENGKFIINYSTLPTNTSATELQKLKDLVSENNLNLQTGLSNSNKKDNSYSGK